MTSSAPAPIVILLMLILLFIVYYEHVITRLKSLIFVHHFAVFYGPLTRHVKLRVAHAPGMPGTFYPPSRVSDPNVHHSTCVTPVPWCMPGSLPSGFLWSRWRGKHSRRMRNPQFYVSGKRPMEFQVILCQDMMRSICTSVLLLPLLLLKLTRWYWSKLLSQINVWLKKCPLSSLERFGRVGKFDNS